MSGDQIACIPSPLKMPLHRGFREVSCLRHNRQYGAKNRQSQDGKPRFHADHYGAGDGGADHPTDQPRPCLIRADAWYQLRSADSAARKISADIGRPDDDHEPENHLQAMLGLVPQPKQSQTRQADVKKPGSMPKEMARRAHAQNKGATETIVNAQSKRPSMAK